MKKVNQLIITCLFYLTIFHFYSCNYPSPSKITAEILEGFELPYDLSEPDQKYKLPPKLNEISGLGSLNSTKIACIQDEEGSVFIFDLQSGQITDKITFGKDGDYEGVELVNGTLYVLRSSGKIFKLLHFGTDSMTTEKFKTSFAKFNNPEAITFDVKYNRILIACSGYPGDEKSIKEFEAIYELELSTGTLNETPIMKFSINDLYNFLGKGNMEIGYNKFIDFFKPGSGSIAFHPSGMSIHPFTGDLYMVSARGNLLVVTDLQGRFKYISQLSPQIFKQPEGLTFMPNGDLFISNEGKDGFANIQYFKYIQSIN